MEVAAALFSKSGVGHFVFSAITFLALPFGLCCLCHSLSFPGQELSHGVLETKGTPTEYSLSMDAAGSGSPAGGT